LFSQTISGTFPEAKNTVVTLYGFDGVSKQQLVQTKTDSIGNFTIVYPANYVGAASLQISDVKVIPLLLHHESFTLSWLKMDDFGTLSVMHSELNSDFFHLIQITQNSSQKIESLKNLINLYKADNSQLLCLESELSNQELVVKNYLTKLSNESLVKKSYELLKIRFDISNTIAQHESSGDFVTDFEIYEKDFMTINFGSDVVWHSGLLDILLTNYYYLILKTNKNDADKLAILNRFNDSWLLSKTIDATRKEALANFCFMELEKRNLNKAAEHIALSMFNQANCKLNDKSINLFEQYRKLAIGNSAPNIVFKEQDINGIYKDLKSLKNAYKLIVFGASWCPNCQTDYPSLVGKYKKIKEKHDLEVVYIAMDTDKKLYEAYFKEAPFITYCDTKGWETQAAKDYFVYATPTYILVNKDLKIVAKLQSPEHLEAWFQEFNK
jgi:thiol-disulfide isomerase/thioredoxin